LSERARAGVKVHLLIDWAGSGRIDGEYLERSPDLTGTGDASRALV